MNFHELLHTLCRKTDLGKCLYKLSAGRSMVEMLSVLAIIGVLSIGAISGYSKAMMRYKLNKQTEQVSQLLANLFTTVSAKTYSVKSEGTDVAALLNKLKMLPDGVKYMGPNTLSFGSYKYRININIRGGENVLYFYIDYGYNKDKISIESCVKTFEIIKWYVNEPALYQVWLERPKNQYYAQNNGKVCWYFEPCLTNMNTIDFYNACKQNYDAYIEGSGSFQQWIQLHI